MYQVFVYGTLKSGFANHDEMLKGEKCLGEYKTIDKFPLVLTGPWNSPVMFPEPGIGEHVFGEVYEVHKDKLKQLDKFEYVNHPKGFRRLTLEVKSNTCEMMIVDAYLRLRKYIKEIRSEYLSNYQDENYVYKRIRKLKK